MVGDIGADDLCGEGCDFMVVGLAELKIGHTLVIRKKVGVAGC